MSESIFNLDNLIVMSDSGMLVPTFVELRSMLIERYKQIYGKDIDLSTGTADGEYVQELSLIINNILQSMKILYSNLNVNSATGVYLESLCALSNVQRKQETFSTASIKLTNLTANDITIPTGEMILQDNAGIIWNYGGKEDTITISGEGELIIPVQCSVKGPVNAPAGWINILVNYSNILVEQSNDASVGQAKESDSQLRARRNSYNSPFGMTVLQALSAALLNIEGIKDVKIYNNNTNASDSSTNDSITIPAHAIYILIRQTSALLEGIEDIIAKTIYNKLTPGILTTNATGCDDGVAKSKIMIPDSMLGQTISDAQETIYWKLCSSINPKFYVEYDEIANSGYAENTGELIYNAIKAYIEELPIGVTIDENIVLVNAIEADPRLNGRVTISNIAISSHGGNDFNIDVNNTDTYYLYSNYNETTSETIVGNKHTLTFE